MKGVKGKMMRKLKSIKPPDYLLMAENFRQAAAGSLDDIVDSFTSLKPNSTRPIKIPILNKDLATVQSRSVAYQETISLEELARELDEDDGDKENGEPRKPISSFKKEEMAENKENVRPSIDLSSCEPVKSTPLESRVLKESNISVSSNSSSVEVDDSLSVRRPPDMNSSTPTSPESSHYHHHHHHPGGISFRRPDLNSLTLFDPMLLEEFTSAVEQLKRITSQEKAAQLMKPRTVVGQKETFKEDDDDDDDDDPLLKFEERCPPGGKYSVILYTTSLRGIRKTFEDCHRVLFLLESFRVVFQARDISMHSEFKEEMWRILGEEKRKLVPPRLFIKGRYIGGEEEVLVLHEQGKLMRLFEGLPRHQRYNNSCEGCGGFRFVVCSKCNGSRKALTEFVDDDCIGSESSDDNGGVWKRCPECNENGLVVCQYC